MTARWAPQSEWWKVPEAEREFWDNVLFVEDSFTAAELVSTFLETGKCGPARRDILAPLVRHALGAMSRYERERLYEDGFLGAFDWNDNVGLPE